MVEDRVSDLVVFMTREELEKRAAKMFGRKWVKPLAKALDLHLATVYRWRLSLEQGGRDIPKYVDIWFEAKEKTSQLERMVKRLTK